MCLAIYNHSKTIDYESLSNAWDNNSDGAGLLYIVKNKLRVFKSYDKKAFIRTYMDIRKKNDEPMLIHFRIATSGFKGKENLHPFLVSPDLGFIHNGIISDLGDTQHSDTWELNEILKKLPNFLVDENIKKLIKVALGTYNKVVFLDNFGNVSFFNEDAGHWVGSDWYSNSTYKYYYYTNWKKSERSSFYDDEYPNSGYWENYYAAKKVGGGWKDDDDTLPAVKALPKAKTKLDEFAFEDMYDTEDVEDVTELTEEDYMQYLNEIFEDNIKESGVSANAFINDMIWSAGVTTAKEYFETFI